MEFNKEYELLVKDMGIISETLQSIVSENISGVISNLEKPNIEIIGV